QCNLLPRSRLLASLALPLNGTTTFCSEQLPCSSLIISSSLTSTLSRLRLRHYRPLPWRSWHVLWAESFLGTSGTGLAEKPCWSGPYLAWVPQLLPSASYRIIQLSEYGHQFCLYFYGSSKV